MDDSFKVRVDRIFGSLSSSSTSTTPALNSSSTSLWCLSDDEIHRTDLIQRNLSDDDDLDDFNDDDADLDDKPNVSSTKPDEYGDEEWEIKSSIGQDCTLDYEEEEDEYDKVAVGKEKVGDRVYMKDVTDYAIEEIDTCSNFTRDPRANHVAALTRLNQDSNNLLSENPKSILKRKDIQLLDTKSNKRVRFDPLCKTSMETNSLPGLGAPTQLSTSQSQVPDYVMNPSRYTHYTFESSNDLVVDEEEAYMDFLQMVNRGSDMESKPDDDIPPKSITFIPKKKFGETVLQNHDAVGKEHERLKGILRGIAAAGDTETDDVCSMEEDEPENSDPSRNSSQKLGRKYRMRAKMLEPGET